MKFESIQLIRNRADGKPLNIFSDNGRLFLDKGKAYRVILDDTNKIGHCIKSAEHHYPQKKGKLAEMISFEYDTIQYLTAILDLSELEVVLNNLVAEGLLTALESTELLSEFGK